MKLMKISFLLTVYSYISVSSSDKIYINAQKQSNGAYKWLSSNSKTFFSKDHLADSSLGDYVVLDPSTSGLTSSDGNTKHKTVCMKGRILFSERENPSTVH